MTTPNDTTPTDDPTNQTARTTDQTSTDRRNADTLLPGRSPGARRSPKKRAPRSSRRHVRRQRGRPRPTLPDARARRRPTTSGTPRWSRTCDRRVARGPTGGRDERRSHGGDRARTATGPDDVHAVCDRPVHRRRDHADRRHERPVHRRRDHGVTPMYPNELDDDVFTERYR